MTFYEGAAPEHAEEAPKEAPKEEQPAAPKPKVKIVEKIVEKEVHPLHELPGERSLEEQAQKRNMN